MMGSSCIYFLSSAGYFGNWTMDHQLAVDHSIRRTGYIPELDTFRLVAILSVMCLHWLPEHCLLNRLQGQISNGVHLFFVLSGYLITGILLGCRSDIEQGASTTGRSLRQFYIRRFLRIFPVYYLVLILGLAFHFKGLHAGFVWHAAYLSNFYYYIHQGFDGPASLFWTLSVEEQFYILWPFAILLLPRRAVFPFVLAIALIGTAFREPALHSDSPFRILLPACMNFLAVGSLGAVAQSAFCGSPQLLRRLLAGCGVFIALLCAAAVIATVHLGWHTALDSSYLRMIDQPMMSMIYLCIFVGASRGIPGLAGKLLRLPPLVYLGKISYGLYVYHLFVTYSLWRGENWIGTFVSAHAAAVAANSYAVRFILTLIVAALSWHLFERPLNDLKRFFPYGSKPRSLTLEERGMPTDGIVSNPNASLIGS